MAAKVFVMADNRSRDAAMSDAILTEMQRITRTAAEPWACGDSVKLGIRRASRTLGISYRRAKAFWYGEDCAVLAREADRLRIEELRIIAAKRQRLEREMAEITARLNARESGKNAMAGSAVGSNAMAGSALVSTEGGVPVHRVGEGPPACRRVAGGEGVIADARQGSLLE
jgi:hypothetical protein